MPAEPEPETDWYDVAIIVLMPAARSSGATPISRVIVVQLGLAMMPRCRRAASSLTPATTSGTSSTRRKAEELSITTAPAAAKAGANFRARAAPAENRAMSTPRGSAVARSSTTTSPQRVETIRPAEREEAMRRSALSGKSRCSRIDRMVRPTRPVAPTMAT